MDLGSGVPELVGPYRLLGQIGAGGMGIVYAGRDGDGRRAAVKLISPAFAELPEFRARFAREIAALSRIGGARVARVLEADIRAAPPWLATEYVPGPTLAERVEQDGPLAEEEVYGLAAGLAEALRAVHEAGVVHRDLKPSNVILSPTGPRLVDFGIARLLDQTAITVTGHMVGSPGWVSPEEYRGDFAGFPADVYGWALMVCFAASGQPPYGVGRPEVLALRVLTEEPDLSAIPEGLHGPVERALAKDPRERPESGPLLEEVTRLWCARHDEPYEAPTADITRILARTWSLPVEEPDAFPPSGEADTPASTGESPALQPAGVPTMVKQVRRRTAHGPEDRHAANRSGRRQGIAATLSVSAVALLALAASVVWLNPELNPLRTPAQIARLAADRIDTLPGIRYLSQRHSVQISAKGFGLAESTILSHKVQLLEVPSTSQTDLWPKRWQFIKAPATFWKTLRPDSDTELLRNYFDLWSYLSWGDGRLNVRTDQPYIATDDAPGGLARILREYGGEASAATLRGSDAIRVSDGLTTIYIARNAPHGLLRVEKIRFVEDAERPLGFATEEMLDSEAGELHRRLSEEVGHLYGALNTDEGVQRTTHKFCGVVSCTAKAKFIPIDLTSPEGARLVMAASFREIDGRGKEGRLIDDCKIERQLTAKQIRSLSITMGCKTEEGWRRWRGKHYRVNTVIAMGMLTRDQVRRLQARLV